MNPNPERIAVTLKAVNNNEATGQVNLKYFTAAERTSRAFKLLGICWGFGVVSVFVPLAHFVLVPGFFIAGIALAIIAHSKKNLILGGLGTCPYCKTPFTIVRMSAIWPLTDQCASCGRQVTIVQQSVL